MCSISWSPLDGGIIFYRYSSFYITTFVQLVQGLTIVWQFSCSLVILIILIIINLFFKQNNKDLSVKLAKNWLNDGDL